MLHIIGLRKCVDRCRYKQMLSPYLRSAMSWTYLTARWNHARNFAMEESALPRFFFKTMLFFVAISETIA